MTKGHIKHELLLTVLLILGTLWIKQAVWPDNDDNFLCSLGCLRAGLLGHGVMLDKVE